MSDDLVESEPKDPLEKFYRGMIRVLNRNSQRGTIRSASGRDLAFIFAHVTMVGPYRSFDDLHEGMEIGFDVSQTSRGLRASVIRIPDRPFGPSKLQRQRGAEQDEPAHEGADEHRQDGDIK